MKARQVGVTLGILIGMGLVGCSPQQGESADRAGKAAEEAVKAAREAGDKAAQALGKASDAVIEASRAIGVRPEAKAPVEPTGPGDTASATPTDPPAGPATRDAMEATREAAANLLELTRKAAASVTGRGLAAPPPDEAHSELAQEDRNTTSGDNPTAN